MNLSEFKKEFQPNILLPSLTAGLTAAIVTISMEISLAALIFSGDLNQFLAGGIGLMLFGALAVGIVVALLTSLPGAISVPQDTPAAIFALIAASIALSMKGAEPKAAYATLVGTIAITSIITGAVYLLIAWSMASWFLLYPASGALASTTVRS